MEGGSCEALRDAEPYQWSKAWTAAVCAEGGREKGEHGAKGERGPPAEQGIPGLDGDNVVLGCCKSTRHLCFSPVDTDVASFLYNASIASKNVWCRWTARKE